MTTRNRKRQREAAEGDVEVITKQTVKLEDEFIEPGVRVTMSAEIAEELLERDAVRFPGDEDAEEGIPEDDTL